MDENILASIKQVLREEDIPFYDDEEIEFFYKLNSQDLNKTLYELLVRKAENTSLNVSGVDVGDESAYFLRLAQKYRPNNSGVLN